MYGKRHITDIIFVLSLFCVFAVLALFVVVLGANVYQGISADMTDNYSARSSVSYLTEKIRQNDAVNEISVQSIGGNDALVLSDGKYATWIYAWDGKLMETTVNEGAAVSPGDGQDIMDAADAEFEYRDGSVQIRTTDAQGNLQSAVVCVRSEMPKVG